MKKTSLLASLAEELVDVARNQTVIEYGKLSKRFGDKYGENYNPRFWRTPLGDVSEVCMDNGLPPISAVVVSKDKGMPGQGFFDFAGRHLCGARVPENQWVSFWQEQLQKVYACDQWDRLLGLIAETGQKAKQLG